MRSFTNIDNIVVGTVVTVMTAVFGAYWYIFAAYMVFNVIDWLTGWYRARKTNTEKSKVGFWGIVKKLGYWAIILVAFLMSDVFVRLGQDILGINLDFLMSIGWFTLACLMVNEVRSILENLVQCGYNVPLVLVKGLEVADKMINKERGEE